MINKDLATVFKQVVGVNLVPEKILVLFVQGIKNGFSDSKNAAL